jgi:hypothetical protein
VQALRGRLDEMVAALRALVEAESQSADGTALHACADRVAALGTLAGVRRTPASSRRTASTR